MRLSKHTLFLLLIILTTLGCKNSIEKVNLFVADEKSPVESTKDAILFYSDLAIMKIQIFAKKADRYTGEEPYTEFTEGIKVLFYDSLQKVESELTAKYGINHDETDIMEVRNDVVVINENGEQLNTEHLIWDKTKALVYTEDFVKITTPNEIIYGQGLESQEDFTKYKIKKIKGTFNLNDEEEFEDTEESEAE